MSEIKDFLSGGWDSFHNAQELSDEQKARFKEEAMKHAKLTAAVFNTPAGREWLEWLRSRTVDEPAFIPGEFADQQGFVREGQNSIYREIMKYLKLASEG